MRGLIIFAAIFSITLCSSAQSLLEFDQLVSEIESNNLLLKVSDENINSEKAALATENNLSDPEVEFSHQWGQKGIGNKWGIGVSQSFEWPGVYSSRAKQIQSKKSALDQLSMETKRVVRLDIRKTLIDIVYYKQLISLANGQMARIDSLYSLYLKGAALGEISKLDINKLKIERINVSRQLNEVQNNYNDSYNKLISLNGGADCSSIVLSINQFPAIELLSIDCYHQLALQNDPSKVYRAYMDEAINFEKKVLKQSNIPGFSIGYSHDYELGEHFNGISLSLTLPFFSNKHKKAEIENRQSLLMAEQAEAENNIKAIIETSFHQVQNLDREINLYSSVLNDFDNLRLLDIALKSGQINLLEYLLEVNYFIDAKKHLLEISHQRALRMSELTQWS